MGRLFVGSAARLGVPKAWAQHPPMNITHSITLTNISSASNSQAGGPSFRNVAKGWESFLLADEMLALVSSPVRLKLVGSVEIEPTTLRLHIYPWITWRESRNSASGHLWVRTDRRGRASSVPRGRAFLSPGKSASLPAICGRPSS